MTIGDLFLWPYLANGRKRGGRYRGILLYFTDLVLARLKVTVRLARGGGRSATKIVIAVYLSQTDNNN